MRQWYALAALMALTACSGGGGSQLSVTDRATADACRQQANTTYAVQNRDQIYRIRDPFTPQSGTGLTELPSRQLSDQFAQERAIRDCIRNTGTETSRTAPAGPAAPTGGASPSGAIAPSGSLSR
jgi:hypothetical protein